MFEFDPAKSASNKRKHGIDFEEAQAVWLDDGRIEIAARFGSDGEERWVVVGCLPPGRQCWTIVVTYRNGRTRIISARRSRNDEEALYDRRGV